jgi:hypothetical protein
MHIVMTNSLKWIYWRLFVVHCLYYLTSVDFVFPSVLMIISFERSRLIVHIHCSCLLVILVLESVRHYHYILIYELTKITRHYPNLNLEARQRDLRPDTNFGRTMDIKMYCVLIYSPFFAERFSLPALYTIWTTSFCSCEGKLLLVQSFYLYIFAESVFDVQHMSVFNSNTTHQCMWLYLTPGE